LELLTGPELIASWMLHLKLSEWLFYEYLEAIRTKYKLQKKMGYYLKIPHFCYL